MGIMTIYTDSYLDNFPLFKSVKKLLDSYEDSSSESIPSSEEFLAHTIYSRWIKLIDLMYEEDELDEGFWKNFNVCLSGAYFNKNNDVVLRYLTAAIGIKVESITRKGNTVSIVIDTLNSSPRLDQLRSLLSENLSDLLLVLDPTIDFHIETVFINPVIDEMPISNGVMVKTVSQFIDLGGNL